MAAEPVPDPNWPRASDWLAYKPTVPRLVVIGVPNSEGSLSGSDAWATPTAFRNVLRRFSTYDSETGIDLRGLPSADWDDWPLAHAQPDEAIDSIRTSTRSLSTTPVYAFIGGDNLITYPLVSGLEHAPLERFGVLTLDAHHDVRSWERTPSNGSPIRALIEEGLPGEHVVQIGIQPFANSEPYRQYCDEQGITVVSMKDVDQLGIASVVKGALGRLSEQCDAIYVDFDLDVLDRSYAPACPGSRPGGLRPRQLQAAARIIGAHPSVVAADFVEVDARADIGDMTLMNLAAAFLSFAGGLEQRDLRVERASQATQTSPGSQTTSGSAATQASSTASAPPTAPASLAGPASQDAPPSAPDVSVPSAGVPRPDGTGGAGP